MPVLTLEEKQNRARQIVEQIQHLEAEMRDLFAPPAETTKQSKKQSQPATLPTGFSVNETVLEALEGGVDTTKAVLVARIKDKYGVELSTTQVQSAISYLKSRNKIDIVGRAIYRLKV